MSGAACSLSESLEANFIRCANSQVMSVGLQGMQRKMLMGSLKSLPTACVGLEASRRKVSGQHLLDEKPSLGDFCLPYSPAQRWVWHCHLEFQCKTA